MYRGMTARMNYLSSDRADIAYAIKELARSMSAPTKGCWERLKRLGRYLVGKPRAVVNFNWQKIPTKLTAYTDADWAGCKESRKSTTGGALTVGTHTLKTWSKTQSLVALSSGESEFYAALKASAEALGMLAIMRDFGWHLQGDVYGDASAALGIIHRKGLGRTRHIDTGLLWIQQTAAEKRLSYHKVLGTENPADLMTKYLSSDVIVEHSSFLGIEFPGGRADTAPALHNVQSTRALWQEEGGVLEEHGTGRDFDRMLDYFQKTVNEVWVKNWKSHVKTLRNLQGQTARKLQHDHDNDHDTTRDEHDNDHDTTRNS